MTEPVNACPSCGSTIAHGYLCVRCAKRAEYALKDILELAGELETTVSKQAVISRSGKRQKGDDQPLPYNDNAAGKGDEALSVLYEWADEVAVKRGWPSVPLNTTTAISTIDGDWSQRRETIRLAKVAHAVGVLKRGHSYLTDDEQGPDCAQAIEYTRNTLRRLIDRPLERVYAGPCHAELSMTVVAQGDVITVVDKPSKCQLALYRKWGSDTIECDGYNDPFETPGCGTIHAASERNEFVLKAIRNELLPLKVVWESLYALLPGCQVSWHVARQWTQTRKGAVLADKHGNPLLDREGQPRHRVIAARLPVRLISLDGVKLYRGRDILELVRDDMKRTGPKRRSRRRLSA